jgi:hypothetical protein
MNIPLGAEVCDALTGFKGIACQILEKLNGSIQIGIQPKLPEGTTTYPDPMNIDHHLLDVIGDGLKDRVTAPTEDFNYKLGSRIRDKVTGIEGIATAKGIYMNGCIYYMLESTKKPDGTIFLDWVDQGRVRLIDDGILAEIKPTIATESGDIPGGPATRMMQPR